ncbi:Pre-rRNA-processing protein ipi3 [Malassezia brasiliensis]|uniref:Pre-rRNA-processing protein IPI3 n=1 Tax=Malassezia brasiliensis TaxID=1821822 RepID=A0AAF0DUN7_9BASI|nr:Pre-rRNA-processing protein ipi3 [Malassezia brasiliensis]
MASTYRSAAALFAPEVLVASSASAAQRGALYVLDAATTSQTPLLHWKGATHVTPHGLDTLLSASHAAGDAGTGGGAVAIDADKAVLTVYAFQRDQPVARIVLPHKMQCVALTPRGDYVATGADDGRLYMWDVANGALLCSFEAHYRALRTLRFSPDGAALATGADDARVCVWSVPSLLGHTDLAGGTVPAAYATLADHTLPISDLHWSAGAFPQSAALWTASHDASVKLWDLSTRRLLSTYTLPGSVSRIGVDRLERFFFASLHEANTAYRVELYTHDPGAWHARGGRGAEGVAYTVGADDPHVALADPITALALSLTSSHVALGTQTGQVHLVDVVTLQPVRMLHATASLTAAPDTPVTNLVAMARPPDLLSAAQLGKRSAHSDADAASSTYVAPLPMRPVAPQFSRTLVRAVDTPTVPMRIGAGAGMAANDVLAYLGVRCSAPSAAAPDTAAPTSTAPASAPDPAVAARVAQLEEDLRRAKALNDEMWQHLVHTHVGAHH